MLETTGAAENQVKSNWSHQWLRMDLAEFGGK